MSTGLHVYVLPGDPCAVEEEVHVRDVDVTLVGGLAQAAAGAHIHFRAKSHQSGADGRQQHRRRQAQRRQQQQQAQRQHPIPVDGVLAQSY